MTVFAVFADSDYLRSRAADIVVETREQALKHVKTLRKLGFDAPIIKEATSEADLYAWMDGEGNRFPKA